MGFARKFFGGLNRELLGPPGDGNFIVLSDSDEEEEVCEEDATPPSAGDSPTPTVSAADADDAPEGVPDDSNDGRTPDLAQGDSSDSGDEAGLP
jgi:hypothetical protein